MPKIVAVSDTVSPIHPIHPVSRSTRTVGSTGFGQMKGEALGLATAEEMVSFYLKSESLAGRT